MIRNRLYTSGDSSRFGLSQALFKFVPAALVLKWPLQVSYHSNIQYKVSLTLDTKDDIFRVAPASVISQLYNIRSVKLEH